MLSASALIKRKALRGANSLPPRPIVSERRGLDPTWKREVLKTIVRMMRSVAGTGREGFNGNGNQLSLRSKRGKVKMEAEILLRISREFGRNVEWLLTGQK
jgi:hypothetical protein